MGQRDQLAERIRRVLADRVGEAGEIVEQRTVGGGLGFMIAGHLCVAATERGLTVRVGTAERPAALAEPGVGPLLVGSRQPKAFVVVEHAGLVDDDALAAWIDRGRAFVARL